MWKSYIQLDNCVIYLFLDWLLFCVASWLFNTNVYHSTLVQILWVFILYVIVVACNYGSTNRHLFVLIDIPCNRYGGRQAAEHCVPFFNVCIYYFLNEMNSDPSSMCQVENPYALRYIGQRYINNSVVQFHYDMIHNEVFTNDTHNSPMNVSYECFCELKLLSYHVITKPDHIDGWSYISFALNHHYR